MNAHLSHPSLPASTGKSEPIKPSRARQMMWVAVVMQVGVIYFSLRMGNYLFAAHAVVQQCLYVMIAWRGEPARGTGMAKVMWGLFAVSGVLIGVVLFTEPQ